MAATGGDSSVRGGTSAKYGETKTVVFRLPANDLAFVGADGKWTLEEGDFLLRIARLSQKVYCTKTKVWDTPNI